ncbi:hypothetical protein ERO13_A04G053826v2 [Gossypium hirsutum]|nr:hypothetical protein ERO13_A04G053826v2 [Gossypium hirsutum]
MLVLLVPFIKRPQISFGKEYAVTFNDSSQGVKSANRLMIPSSALLVYFNPYLYRSWFLRTFLWILLPSCHHRKIIYLHGIPSTIVMDRDPRFMQDFWQELHHLQGTELAISTPYHPQTGEQAKALNKCLKMLIPQILGSQCYHGPNDTFEVPYGQPPPIIIHKGNY